MDVGSRSNPEIGFITNGDIQVKKRLTCWNNIRSAAFPALLIGSCLISLPAVAQECEVRLGVVGPMTGGSATLGLSEKAATEFEAAWTNANGGLQVGNRKCKVSVISVDGQSTAAGGAAASNYLASENVHAVVGPIPSPETVGFLTVAKRNGQVNFSSSFATHVISPDFPLAFVKVQTAAVWGPTVIKAAKARYGFRKAVVVGPNDQGGTDAGNELANAYRAAGVPTTTEWYQRGTSNFSPLVTRLMSMNVDTVEVGSMPPGEGAILAKQLLQVGYAGAIGKLGAGGEAILTSLGGVQKQKAFYWFDHAPTEDPGIKKMNADFERLMKSPVPEAGNFYTAQIAAEQMLKAISLAGTDQDGEKIAAELRKMTPDSRYLGKAGWRGMKQYGIDQQFSFPVSLNMISNGHLEPQVKVDIPSE